MRKNGTGWEGEINAISFSTQQVFSMNPEKLICDTPLLRHIRSNLSKFKIVNTAQKGNIHAAVAITVVDVSSDPGLSILSIVHYEDHDAALVLTRRSSRLKDHSGQWAFPGGQMETNESAEETALRELKEEVGLALHPENIIGRLDDFSTRSGFTITPVVVWGGSGVRLIPNPEEVSSIHRIPIAEFLRPDAPLLEEIPESKHPILRMPVGDSHIAAPTAALIYQFREVAILGKSTRVSHYEQPYFAWQ
jgi:8-oxo-dGTP pyrophosphatase MutT (NUDIX family)